MACIDINIREILQFYRKAIKLNKTKSLLQKEEQATWEHRLDEGAEEWFEEDSCKTGISACYPTGTSGPGNSESWHPRPQSKKSGKNYSYVNASANETNFYNLHGLNCVLLRWFNSLIDYISFFHLNFWCKKPKLKV